MRMNEYVKEGKRFLNTVNGYFEEYCNAVGCVSNIFSRYVADTSSRMPDPNRLIARMSHLRSPQHYMLPLKKYGMSGFDGYFVIGDEDGNMPDDGLEVIVSGMGAWQLTLLLVLAKHIMPLYWHANYMEWRPIFDDASLCDLRDSKRMYSDDNCSTYSFIPKDLPAEPEVEAYDDGRGYKVSFYVWTDFGGYLEIIANVIFPKERNYVKVSDVKISTKINRLYEYRCGVTF